MSDSEKTKRPLKGRVFQCTGFANCNKSFTRSEHLARHRRKHTGERPFSCSHCSKNFSRLDNLRQHKQTVHAHENYMKVRSDPEPSAAALHLPTPHNRFDYVNTTGYAPLASSQSRRLTSPPLSGSSLGTYLILGYLDKDRSSLDSDLPLHSHTLLNLLGDRNLRHPPQFNPKVRPRPLSLALSSSDDAVHRAPVAILEPPIKTAPPVAYNSSSSFFPDLCRAALRVYLMDLMVVSPLSPLFHQSFNQVASSTPLFLHPTSLRPQIPKASSTPFIPSIITPESKTDAKLSPKTEAVEPSQSHAKVNITNLLSDDYESPLPPIKVENH